MTTPMAGPIKNCQLPELSPPPPTQGQPETAKYAPLANRRGGAVPLHYPAPSSAANSPREDTATPSLRGPEAPARRD